MNLTPWKSHPSDVKIRVNVDSSRGKDILVVCNGRVAATITRPGGKTEYTVVIGEADYKRAVDMLRKLKAEGIDLDQ